jgi:branched-subunit amino acid aminotransferase/4-amino-4-deoxychorismate lyase
MAADFEYFSKNGEILPIDQASIPLSNIEYSYGFGVYESLKIRNNILYFVDQHIERLFKSAEVIGLTHPFKQSQIKEYIHDLFSALKTESYNLKILLIGGDNPLLFIIPLSPRFPDRKLYSAGTKTITFKNERLFPHAKTLNMLPSYIAYKKAKENDCYDALLIDSSGNIVEGTRTNFFTLRDKTIFSPPKGKILEGVTKLTVLHVAKLHGFNLEETDIPLSEVSKFDGAFLTSTSAKIVPIKQIDDFVFPQIPETLKELMDAYDNFLKESKGIFK